MSRQNKDQYDRVRSKTIAFRVSPEEDERINFAVSLSGMTKQDFITSKLLDRTINIQASCKIHRAVHDRLRDVLEELKRIESEGQITEDLRDNLILVTHLVEELYTA